MRMHSLNHSLFLGATSDIGLVGGNDQYETGRFQACTAFCNALEQCELPYRGRWVGFAVVYDRTVQGAVAVEKNSGPDWRREHVRRGKSVRKQNQGLVVMDSHLVWFTFKSGCETKRCQITAWNASEWGVTLFGLTVGTITHASATLAV